MLSSFQSEGSGIIMPRCESGAESWWGPTNMNAAPLQSTLIVKQVCEGGGFQKLCLSEVTPPHIPGLEFQ